MNDGKSVEIEEDNTMNMDISNNNNFANANDFNNSSARVNLLISFDAFNIEILKEQYDIITNVVNEISNYQKLQYNYSLTRKYKYFRTKLYDNKNKYKYKYKLLWRFAIRMVIKQIKFNKGEYDVFNIPKEIKDKYYEDFTILYPKYYLKEKLNDEELAIFKNIVTFVDMKDLFMWSKPVLNKIFIEEKKKKDLNKKKVSSIDKKEENKFELSQEEIKQIEDIIEKLVNEEIDILKKDEIEIKLKINVILLEGSFKFSIRQKKDNVIINEGININFKHFSFNIKKRGENLSNINLELKELDMSMSYIINNNITTIPITFKYPNAKVKDDYYFLRFAINTPISNDKVNSNIFIQINTLNFIYNRSFLYLIISFFTVDIKGINEQLSPLLFEENIIPCKDKKNLVNITINKPQILIPINKYDINHSKIILFDFGDISITTNTNTLPHKYNAIYTLALSPSNILLYTSLKEMNNDFPSNSNGFVFLYKFTCLIEICLIDRKINSELPFIHLNAEVCNFNIQLTEYIFPLLIYITEILKPNKDEDIWSQVNINKEEINANTLNITKVNKKNNISFTWEDYTCVLSGGFLYFYYNVEDEEYIGYFYLRDTVITHPDKRELIVTLYNKYGSIDLMFNTNEEMQKWEDIIQKRITEMKISYNNNNSNNILLNSNANTPLLSLNITVKTFQCILYKETSKLSTLDGSNININITISTNDISVSFIIDDASLKDPYYKEEEFEYIIKNNSINSKERTPFIQIKVIIYDEHSLKYKEIQYAVELKFTIIKIIWIPQIIQSILSVFVHNDVMKSQITQEISNKNTQHQSFIRHYNEGMMKKKCNEYSYTYISAKANCDKFEFIWIHPALNSKFAFIAIDEPIINANLKEDHYTIECSLTNIKAFDLSNYPYKTPIPPNDTYTTQILGNKTKPATSPNTHLIKFSYISMYNWCPKCKDNFLSKVSIQISNLYLIYLHEHFIRTFTYLTTEFLGSLTASQEIKAFQLEQYNEKAKNEKDIDFMELNISISNSEARLKPRFVYENFFIANADNIHITCSYEKVFGKVRNEINEYRYISKYKFEVENLNIKSEDGFVICDKTKGVVNMHCCEYTESDKIIYSDVEFDFSYQFDVLFNEVNINLRQKDFTNIMKLVDLNIVYSDGEKEKYDYEKIRLEKKKESNLFSYLKLRNNNKHENNIDDLKEKYNYILAFVIFNKINITLFKTDNSYDNINNINKHDFPFAEINFTNFNIDISQKLNTNIELHIATYQFDAFHISDKSKSKRELILSSLNENKKELNIANIINYIEKSKLLTLDDIAISSPQFACKARENTLYEKEISAKIYGFKMIFKYDTLNLIYEFFINGFPYYTIDKDKNDLPCNFNPDEENYPLISLSLEIINPLICLLTDSLSNKSQDVICLTSNTFIELRNEQISKIKKMIINKSNNNNNNSNNNQLANNENSLSDEGNISHLKISFSDICLFFSNLTNTPTPNSIKRNTMPLRRFMDPFTFSFQTKNVLQLVSSSSFIVTSISKITVNHITFKASYKDIVLLYKIISYNSLTHLLNSPKSKSQKILNNRLSHITFLSQGMQIILIDDNANTFYPFLSFSISEFFLFSESLNKEQRATSFDITFKVLSYNYFAGEWEPMIEKTHWIIEMTIDKSEQNIVNSLIYIKTISIKKKPDININISDMSLSFLIKTLRDWTEKLKHSISTNNITNDNSTVKISNHTVVNYSGRKINLYRKIKEKFIIIGNIGVNEEFEIDYFANENDTQINKLNKSDNVILFDLDNENKNPLVVKNNVINIDHFGDKIHPIVGLNIKENFITSKISFKNKILKKYIYFYSPLCFENKTSYIITIFLLLKPTQKNPTTITINPNDTFGIPHEFLSKGTFKLYLKLKDTYSPIYHFSSFLSSDQILEEINFNEIYLNIFHPKCAERTTKIIQLRISYTIRNCLPFEIQVILKEQNQIHFIKTNESIEISSLSITKNLKCFIYFYNFHTAKEVILYNLKANTKKTINPITLEDNNKNHITIYASCYTSTHKEIVIHCKTVLINHTGLDMKVFYSKGDEKRIEVANQVKDYNVFILNDEREKFLQFCTKDNEYISKKTTYKGIGTTSVINLYSIRDQRKKKCFIMKIKLSLLIEEIDLYSTVVYLVPRIVICNHLEVAMRVMIGEQPEVKVEIGKRVPFFYYEDTLIRFLPIGQDGQSQWELSSPISFVSGAFSTLKSYKKNDKEVLYFNLEKKVDELSTYFILSKPSFQTNQITIQNLSKKVDVKVYQSEYDKRYIYLPTCSESLFAWNDQFKNNKICFIFYIKDKFFNNFSEEKVYELGDEKVTSFNSDNSVDSPYPYSDVITIRTGNYDGNEIIISIKSEGIRFRILINDYTTLLSASASQTHSKEYEIKVSIEKLGLNIICDNRNIFLNENNKQVNKYMRNEICYITFEQIVFYDKIILLSEEISNRLKSNETYCEMQLIINNMQIDNEIYGEKNFPVILIPTAKISKSSKKSNSKSSITSMPKSDAKSKSYSSGGTKLSNSFSLSIPTTPSTNSIPFINAALTLVTNQNDTLTRIKFFNYLIQEFILNLESSVLSAIYNFLNNINTDLKSRSLLLSINPIFLSSSQLSSPSMSHINISESFFKPTWLTSNSFYNHKQNLFISELRASSLEIKFTFLNQTRDKIAYNMHKLFQSNRVFTSLMFSTFSNVEGVSLSLNGCELHNFSGNWENLISNILYEYQQKMLFSLLKLFGSIDIIGDPLNLMTSLGKGFKALLTKPAKGIMKGPLQGAIGLVDGTLSLAKHTIEGTLGSTSKLTSGISKSFLLLTLDEKYIHRRENKKFTQRPKNAIEGIGYGLTSMAGGVLSGISDLVMKPIEGAKKEKMKGLGKGILKGVSGVMFKPISGVFDLVSKTTEGIKNNVRKEDFIGQRRLGRAFYGKCKVIKAYNALDAQVNSLLGKIDEIKGEFDFYSCEVYKNRKDVNMLLAFISGGINVIDIDKRELKTIIEYKNIKDVIVDDNGKVIVLFKGVIENEINTSIKIKDNTNDPVKIMQKIKEIVEMVSEDVE